MAEKGGCLTCPVELAFLVSLFLTRFQLCFGIQFAFSWRGARGEEGSRFHPRDGCCVEEHGYLFVEMLQNFGPSGHKLLDIPISTGFLFILVSSCILSLCSVKSILLLLLLLSLMQNLCL